MRKSKISNLKVFKLRSGEEIIAKVSGKSRGKIKLFRPMLIMNNIHTDSYSGSKRHVVFFSDWLGSSADTEVSIPLDFIVAQLPPDPDMISLYSRQTEIDDKNSGNSSTASSDSRSFPIQANEAELQKMAKEMDKKLEEMLKQLAAEGATGDTTRDKQKPESLGGPPFPLFPPFMPPQIPKPQTPDGILFSILISKEIMNSWIESGVIEYLKDCIGDFINTEFIEDMMNIDAPHAPKKKKNNKQKKITKEKWNEPTEDRKKNPNYGNSVDDWSPYIKDFLPDEDPPKKEESD